MKKVLIVTSAGDTHAYAVEAALRAKGAPTTVWHASDFPVAARETVCFVKNSRAIRVQDAATRVDLVENDVIWYRRPASAAPSPALHASDLKHAEMQVRLFRSGLLYVLSADRYWVNPMEAATRANAKILQQEIATQIGFDTPSTLYSNDPDEIRNFFDGRRVVFKPLLPVPWRRGTTSYNVFTTEIGLENLVVDELLQAVPAIYQELVPKAFELRVTVFGSTVMAARVLSQDTVEGVTDWRRAYDELRFEPCRLDHATSAKCITMLRALGLRFGCFDFIVTPDDRILFLEVNQAGQFLFLESMASLPLLDAFSDFLLAASDDFMYDRAVPAASYAVIRQQAELTAAQRLQVHAEPPTNDVLEDTS